MIPAGMARNVRALIRKYGSGTVMLVQATPGAPDPETPWLPGEPTVDVYALDARVDGVSAGYVDGTTVLATDVMVIASPKATHTLSDGEPADGAIVDVVPTMTDVLRIDGQEKAIKKIEAVPAAGPPARYHIFVAS